MSAVVNTFTAVIYFHFLQWNLPNLFCPLTILMRKMADNCVIVEELQASGLTLFNWS